MSVSARQKAAPVAARTDRNRRRRALVSSTREPIRHVTLPFCITATSTPLPDDTIGSFLDRTKWATKIGRRRCFALPTICVVNGQPVLQRFWTRRRIKPGDRVEFWSKPWGKSGNGKQILGIVALIALAAFVPAAAGSLGGLLGLGTVGTQVLSGILLMGGALLINALVAPKPGGQGDNSDQVELFSIAAQGNTARLFQPLPVQYGRVKSFPDFAITPWSEFEGNDQYLNVLLSVGLGRYSFETLFVDDSILWTSQGGISESFTGVTLDFYEPNEQVTLFPVNVVQSDQVSGQEITDTFVGGFIANPPGTTTNQFSVDIVFPAGCFNVDTNSGNLLQSSVTVQVEARTVNDAGAPLTPFTPISQQTFSFATRNPQRQTIKTTVNPGRWEVRVRRTTKPPTTGTEVNGVVWAGLRASIPGPASFPVSTVAIRIKATNQLTQSSARKFGVLCTRILNVWNGTTFVPLPTRNPYWAAWDMAIDTDYGIGRPPSKIDFQTLTDQAAAADARDDHFDFRFVSATAAPDALDTILRPARSRHRWSGDVLTFVRDEFSDVPRMLLTDREIVRGTFNVEYALNPDNSADSVILEYVDENTWTLADVQYPPNAPPPNEFIAVNPTRVRIDGIVNRDHAFREAAFFYLQSQFRRITITLDTEHDGRMLGFGSRIRVQSELPLTWGSTGAVVARLSNVLIVSPAPKWAPSGNHFIAIRTKTGRQFGPIKCTQGVDTAHIVLDAADLASVEAAQLTTLADALARADGADDPSFDFGPGDSRARDCVVMTGRPARDRVTLGLAVDDRRVHNTDLGNTPIVPSVPPLRDPPTPIVTGLFANFKQGVLEPVLQASWWPAPGAQFYRADVSYDVTSDTPSWTPVYEGIEPKFSAVVTRAGLRLRVQGVGVRQGPFAVKDVEAPEIALGDNVVTPESLNPELAARIRQIVEQVPNDIQSLKDDLNRISGAVGDLTTVSFERMGRAIIGVGSVTAENQAGVQVALNAATDVQNAFASFVTSLFADGPNGSANGFIRFVVASSPTGVASSFAIEVNVGTPGAPNWASAGIFLDAIG